MKLKIGGIIKARPKFIKVISVSRAIHQHTSDLNIITILKPLPWLEAVKLDWNQVVGADKQKILNAYRANRKTNNKQPLSPYGDGNAAVNILLKVVADA